MDYQKQNSPEIRPDPGAIPNSSEHQQVIPSQSAVKINPESVTAPDSNTSSRAEEDVSGKIAELTHLTDTAPMPALETGESINLEERVNQLEQLAESQNPAHLEEYFANSSSTDL